VASGISLATTHKDRYTKDFKKFFFGCACFESRIGMEGYAIVTLNAIAIANAISSFVLLSTTPDVEEALLRA